MFRKKKIHSIVITALFFTSLTAQNWEQTGAGKTIDNLNAVCFADNQTAFAVGKNATMLKSTDSGQTWAKVNHGVSIQELWAIQFPNAAVGYAAGASGTVLKTTDGGNTWIDISGNLPSNAQNGLLLGIHFKSTDIGFIVGNPGLILQTSDGGNSWQSRNSITSDGYLRSLDFAGETTAYVVGNNGLIKQSTDGGITWNLLLQGTNPPDPSEYTGLPNVPFGVNLSGGEFGGHYTAQGDPYPGIYGTHYAYPVPENLDYFKNKGLKLIRFPFRWERIQRELNGPLYMDDVNKMKDLVRGANAREMNIFIDMHNFGRRGISEYNLKQIDAPNSGITRHHLADAWKKLAIEFKDLNCWGYDIMNEPHDMGTASWLVIAQEVIDSIRKVDMNTSIIICGDRWSSAYHWPGYSDQLKNLQDPADKLIYQAHLYFDANESGAYSGSYDSESCTPETGVDRALPFVNWLKENKKKGILGEYGIPHDDERWQETLENLLIYLRNNAVPGTYWSAGTRWGGYTLSVDPSDANPQGSDRPQMKILEKYTITNTVE
jgi:endoglucanase